MKVNYLTIGGKRHPVCFSLGAGEELVTVLGHLDVVPQSVSAQWTRR